MTEYNELKTLFYTNEDIIDLCTWLKSSISPQDGLTSLIITPSPSASKKVFREMLSSLDFEIARHVRDGDGYEFIFEDDRISIQDVTYLLNYQRKSLKFKSVTFME